MAIIQNNGLNPYYGQVTTTMGIVAPRSPLCEKCHERKPELYTKNVNGQTVCPACAGSAGVGVLAPEEVGEDGV